MLRLNYRNTDRILSAAYRMIEQLAAAMDADEEAIRPERAIRTGPPPVIMRCGSRAESWREALEWIRRQLAAGVSAADVLVLGLSRLEMMEFASWLRTQGVAARMLGGDEASDGVHVSTVHGAKGLDADAVLLLALHRLQGLEEGEARRLLYIAMTRARRELAIHSHAECGIVDALERATRSSESGALRLTGAV